MDGFDCPKTVKADLFWPNTGRVTLSYLRTTSVARLPSDKQAKGKVTSTCAYLRSKLVMQNKCVVGLFFEKEALLLTEGLTSYHVAQHIAKPRLLEYIYSYGRKITFGV